MNDEIHVDDFLRLTGARLGPWGDYLIEESGVAENVGDISPFRALTPDEQADLLEFKRKAKLYFPCTPQRLIEWVNDTHGEFTLPSDFLQQIEEEAKARAEAEERVMIPGNIPSPPPSVAERMEASRRRLEAAITPRGSGGGAGMSGMSFGRHTRLRIGNSGGTCQKCNFGKPALSRSIWNPIP